MKSPAAAMGWELWQKNRWAFIVLGAPFYLCIGWILTSLTVSYFYGISIGADSDIEGIGILGLALTWLVLFAVFGHTDDDPRKGFSGFPTRMFLLPVRTRTLIQWPVLYGVGAIVFYTMAWVLFVFWPGHLQPPLGYLLLLASAAMVSFQALVWGLASFPKTRIAALLIWAFGLIVMAVGSQAGSDRGILAWILAGVLVAGWLGIEVGVQAERSGGWQGWYGWQRWLNPWVVWRRKSAVPFRSAQQAQFWIEWRRNGRLALAIVAGFAGLLLIWTVLGQENQSDPNWAAPLLTPMVILVVFTCFLGGPMVPNDAATARYAMSAFIAVRPAATADLCRAKFKVAARIFLCLLPLLAVLCVSWMVEAQVLPSTLGQWRSQDEGFLWPQFFRGLTMVAVGTVVPYSLLLGALPVWLTGRMPGFPWSFTLLMVAMLAVFNWGGWLFQSGIAFDSSGLTDQASAVLGLALLLKMGFAYLVFRESHRRALMTRRFILGYIAIWLLVSGLLLVLSDKVGHELQPMGQLVSWMLILIFPLGRVGWSPLALAWNRHR
jgi:hypothetical protein